MKWIIQALIFLGLIHVPGFLGAQKNALRQPECLLQSDKEIRIDQIISDNCQKGKGPWVVFSNRGSDFGKKYFVVKESLTELLIYSGTGSNGLTIQSPFEVGWRPKSTFLFHFSADFTRDALIHRKCVVLNSQGLIDSICMGLAEESRIPVYNSPVDDDTIDFLPLYSIYFIYQSENRRYLLGRDYTCSPEATFSSQIIGWVDAMRVFNYDNRLCFEPNFQTGAVQKRRCDPVYGNAKVFSSAHELNVFVTNRHVGIEPLWEEPDYFYLPAVMATDLQNGKMKIETLRRTIQNNCKPGTDCFKSFPNKPVSADFFRFPFLESQKGDRKVFQVAATGKYIRTRQSICDSLLKNKNRLNVFFIIPDSLPNAYSVFFLNQLQTKYTGFTKRYNGCYYPGTDPGKPLLTHPEHGKLSYTGLLDSLMGHKPFPFRQGEKNCFAVLKHVLESESFNSQETNLVVLINGVKTPSLSPETTALIAGKLAEKNCYLLTFDLTNNASFQKTVDGIMRKATEYFRVNHDLGVIPFIWQLDGKCSILTNYLLAAAWSIDTTELKGPQIMDYIQASYDPVIKTITQVINAECSNRADTIGLTPNETAFRLGLEKLVPGCGKSINSMRILQKGYIRMRYQEPRSSIDSVDNTWQAEVLMTEEELDDLTSAIDGLTIDLTSTNVCERICDLWQILIRRFIGENMILNSTYLEYTIPQILDKMIGASFGYNSGEKIKKINLRQICECQDDVSDAAIEYQARLGRKNNELKTFLNQKPFKIERENGKTSNINYYWVPVFLLP